jgi:hypothetical protein
MAFAGTLTIEDKELTNGERNAFSTAAGLNEW